MVLPQYKGFEECRILSDTIRFGTDISFSRLPPCSYPLSNLSEIFVLVLCPKYLLCGNSLGVLNSLYVVHNLLLRFFLFSFCSVSGMRNARESISVAVKGALSKNHTKIMVA